MIEKLKRRFNDWLNSGIPAKDAHLMDDVIDTSPMQYKTKRLCDVTCFRGPNGVFSVSQDEDLWVVDKVQLGGVFPQADQTNIKTIFPRDPGDKLAGTFLSSENAMKAARNWAGVVVEPTHPVPNRRAAIAHTKAKSC